jgi:hypothetical protein
VCTRLFLTLSESKQVVEKSFGLSLLTLIVFIGVYQTALKARLLQDLPRIGHTCSVQPSNHVVHTNHIP